MNSEQKFLQNLYEAFNKREIETIISLMHADVKWANGMEGGFVHGRDAVREYWTKQFQIIDPQLQPLDYDKDEKGRNVVAVYQTVKDLDGSVLLEKTVKQIFTIKDGLITEFEIGDPEPFLKSEIL